jgi:hypothetical protein
MSSRAFTRPALYCIIREVHAKSLLEKNTRFATIIPLDNEVLENAGT